MNNPNSDYYQDKCTIYTSEYNTDLTSYDRKIIYNEKFLALCEKDCTYKGYDNVNKRVSYECKTKTEFLDEKLSEEHINLKEVLSQFKELRKIIINLYVITCYKQLFCSKGFKKNLGSYINIPIIVAGIALIILFCTKGYNSYIKKKLI